MNLNGIFFKVFFLFFLFPSLSIASTNYYTGTDTVTLPLV